MINGTVALYEHESEWHPTGLGFNMSSKVCIGGEEKYKLRYEPQWKTKSVKYQLLDLSGRLLHEWFQKQRWLGARMDFSILPEYPLEYVIKWTGGSTFMTPTQKFPPYFTILNKSKVAEIDGMLFEHHDFASEIHFKCPEARVPQAILIANLLFNVPSQSSDESDLSIGIGSE